MITGVVIEVIWILDEEDVFLPSTSSPRTISKSSISPGSISAGSWTNLNASVQNEINRAKSEIYNKTVGYGLIALGGTVLLATRGKGWKPAAVIMSTGLNNLAEVSE